MYHVFPYSFRPFRPRSGTSVAVPPPLPPPHHYPHQKRQQQKQRQYKRDIQEYTYVVNAQNIVLASLISGSGFSSHFRLDLSSAFQKPLLWRHPSLLNNLLLF